MWQVFGRVLVVLSATVLMASFAGEIHGAGDSLAVFRPVLIGGVFVSCVLVYRWWIARFWLVCVVAVTGVHVWQILPKTTTWNGSGAVIYQKNLLFRPSDRSDLIADIRSIAADVVTLQEVSRENLPLLAILEDEYPYQLLCDGHAVGAVAILSKTILEGQGCSGFPGYARAVTVIGAQPVQVFAIHLHWPWPFGQRDHLLGLLENMTPMEDAYTVVGGDFNMVASGRPITWVETATQTQRVGPLVKTFELYGYPLGIDHIFATGGGTDLMVRPQLGSDHYGLVARISWDD